MSKTTKISTKNVKLIGGPMGGRLIAVPRSAESYLVGKVGAWFWRYTYAGKDGRQELFAIEPKSRRMLPFIHWYVGKFGRDPRIESAAMRQQPTTNPGRVAHGRGAAKRAAKRKAS